MTNSFLSHKIFYPIKDYSSILESWELSAFILWKRGLTKVPPISSMEFETVLFQHGFWESAYMPRTIGKLIQLKSFNSNFCFSPALKSYCYNCISGYSADLPNFTVNIQ